MSKLSELWLARLLKFHPINFVQSLIMPIEKCRALSAFVCKQRVRLSESNDRFTAQTLRLSIALNRMRIDSRRVIAWISIQNGPNFVILKTKKDFRFFTRFHFNGTSHECQSHDAYTSIKTKIVHSSNYFSALARFFFNSVIVAHQLFLFRFWDYPKLLWFWWKSIWFFFSIVWIFLDLLIYITTLLTQSSCIVFFNDLRCTN